MANFEIIRCALNQVPVGSITKDYERLNLGEFLVHSQAIVHQNNCSFESRSGPILSG